MSDVEVRMSMQEAADRNPALKHQVAMVLGNMIMFAIAAVVSVVAIMVGYFGYSGESSFMTIGGGIFAGIGIVFALSRFEQIKIGRARAFELYTDTLKGKRV